MPEHLLDSLDVFYGELTPARATVYARLEGLKNAAGLSLSGSVRGPRCFYSTTLLSTYPLADAGTGPSLLAKALVPDPCYWSPETPNIYDVTVELRRGRDIIASEVRQIGFKPLGISGRFFTWEGKPWVLRGVDSRMLYKQATIGEWRSSSATMIVSDLNDALLSNASEQGVMCFVCIDKLDCARKRALAKYPAVAIAHSAKSSSVQTCGLNIICSQYCTEGSQIVPGVQVVLGDSVQDLIKLSKAFSGPVMADRDGAFETLAVARAACDKLQADLAPYGQFAGYIV